MNDIGRKICDAHESLTKSAVQVASDCEFEVYRAPALGDEAEEHGEYTFDALDEAIDESLAGLSD